MSDTAAQIWADGDPLAPLQPDKARIRAWGTYIETIIAAFLADGGLIYTTKALLLADLAHPQNSSAWVMSDPVVANNGIYAKAGPSGSGTWNRVGDLPFSFIVATDAGAGTANAIQATTTMPVSASALVICNVFRQNTGSPVTISFNGATPLTIKSNAGNDIVANGLAPLVFGYVSGTTFQLLNDQVASSIVAAAEAAAAEAEAAAAFFPLGGTTGQILAKTSNADRDVYWFDPFQLVAMDLMAFGTIANAQAAHPPAAPSVIMTAAYDSNKIEGSGGFYAKVAAQPTHAGKFSITLADGTTVVWYELQAFAGIVRPEQFGARHVGTNAFDDRAAINAAITYGNIKKGVTVQLASAKYYISDSIIGQSNVTLRGINAKSGVGSGVGTEISGPTTGLPAGHFIQASGVIEWHVDNIRILGDRATAAANQNCHGIAIFGPASQFCSVTNCYVANVRGTSIYCSATKNNENYAITISDNWIVNSYWGIVCFKGVYTFWIERNYINNTRDNAILCDDATNGDTLSTANSNQKGFIRHNRIVGVALDNAGCAGINVSALRGGSVEGNYIEDVRNGGWGINLNSGQDAYDWCQDVTVLGNQIQNTGGASINLQGAVNCTVSGNTCKNAWAAGAGSQQALVTVQNNVSGNGTGTATGTFYNAISGNALIGSTNATVGVRFLTSTAGNFAGANKYANLTTQVVNNGDATLATGNTKLTEVAA